MKVAFKWALERLQEKSTWLGIVGLASSIGWYLDPAMANSIIQLGVGLASAIAVITKEKSP